MASNSADGPETLYSQSCGWNVSPTWKTASVQVPLSLPLPVRTSMRVIASTVFFQSPLETRASSSNWSGVESIDFSRSASPRANAS